MHPPTSFRARFLKGHWFEALPRMQNKSTKRLKETAKSYLFSFSADHWLGMGSHAGDAAHCRRSVPRMYKPGTAELDQHNSTWCIIGETRAQCQIYRSFA